MSYLEIALEAEARIQSRQPGDPRDKRDKRENCSGRCPDCQRFITEHGPGSESQCLRCPAWSRVVVPEIVMRACREGRRVFAAEVAAGRSLEVATEASEQAEERVLAGGGYRPRFADKPEPGLDEGEPLEAGS